jgi:hypothetical protein
MQDNLILVCNDEYQSQQPKDDLVLFTYLSYSLYCMQYNTLGPVVVNTTFQGIVEMELLIKK